MATTVVTVAPPSYLSPLVLANRLVAPEWLRWFNQLKLSADSTSDNAAAIAALQAALASTNANVANLTARVTAVETKQATDEAAIAALQTGLAATTLQTSKNTLELVNHEFRIEQLETYKNTWAIKSVSANYTVVYSDFTIEVDASGGAVTITLPAAANLVAGEYHNVKKIDSTLNIVTISGNGKLIDGVASIQLLLPNWAVGLQYDGAAWKIL